MRPIVLALSRDYLRRILWPSVWVLFYFIGFPWLTGGLMSWQGYRLPVETIAAIPLSFTFVAILLPGAVLVVWIGQGENRFGIAPRLYCLPLETWLLVVCRMLQCAATIFTLYVITTAAYNEMFGTNWPLVAPVAGLVVLGWWVQAWTWAIMDFRLSKFLGLLAVLISLGYGIAWHLRPSESDGVAVVWRELSLVEGLALVGYAIGALALGLHAVERHRHGDAIGFLIWLTRWDGWWKRLFVDRLPRFESAEHAVYWMEWTRRGFVMPAIVAFLATVVPLIGATGLADGMARPIDILEIQLVLGLAMLPQMAFIIGMAVGHRNTNSSAAHYDSYSATRPLTDAALASIFLRSTLRSVVSAYGVATACCLPVLGWVCLQQGPAELASLTRKIPLFAELGLWSIPVLYVAVLLATWAAMGVGATIVLLGRMRLITMCVILPIGVVIVWVIFINLILPKPISLIVAAAGAGVFGLICLSGTAWAFVRAVRRGLTTLGAGWISLFAWLALCGITLAILSFVPSSASPPPPAVARWLALPLLPGLLALVFAPLAAAPLALQWNRHQ